MLSFVTPDLRRMDPAVDVDSARAMRRCSTEVKLSLSASRSTPAASSTSRVSWAKATSDPPTTEGNDVRAMSRGPRMSDTWVPMDASVGYTMPSVCSRRASSRCAGLTYCWLRCPAISLDRTIACWLRWVNVLMSMVSFPSVQWDTTKTSTHRDGVYAR